MEKAREEFSARRHVKFQSDVSLRDRGSVGRSRSFFSLSRFPKLGIFERNSTHTPPGLSRHESGILLLSVESDLRLVVTKVRYRAILGTRLASCERWS